MSDSDSNIENEIPESRYRRLLEEMSSGRADLIQQVRSEIKLLARTIAASSQDPS